MRKNSQSVAHYVAVTNYIARREEISNRMMEIADAMEKENNREMTDAEKAEVEALKREANVIDLKIRSARDGQVAVSSREAKFDQMCREALANKQPIDIALKREDYINVTTQTNATSLMPVTVEAVVKPLEEGLIFDKVGLKLYTGLAGQYVLPTFETIEAEVAGEAVELTDVHLNLDKIKPVPQRVGISIALTNQLINQTEGVAYNIVMEQLPLAIARTLNKCMFNTDTSSSIALVGPFKAAAAATAVALSTLNTKAKKKAARHIAFVGALPTYKELLAMKGIALMNGVEPIGLAYVMDEYTKSELESTPRDEGSGLMIVEDGKVAGIPVFCTNNINTATATNVAFGAFGNALCQQFGEMRLIVDPFGQKKKDAIEITLNSDWAMDAIHKEAFILGTCTEA